MGRTTRELFIKQNRCDNQFTGRTYSELVNCGQLVTLKQLLGSEQGRAVQVAILIEGYKEYVKTL